MVLEVFVSMFCCTVCSIGCCHYSSPANNSCSSQLALLLFRRSGLWWHEQDPLSLLCHYCIVVHMSRSSSVVEYCLLVGGGTARESELGRLAPDGVGGGPVRLAAAAPSAACLRVLWRGRPLLGCRRGRWRSSRCVTSSATRAGRCGSCRRLLPLGTPQLHSFPFFPFSCLFRVLTHTPLYCVVSLYPIYHKITPKSWSKVSNDRN